MPQPFDEAAGVGRPHGLHLGFAVMVQPGALVRENHVGHVHAFHIAGEWDRHQQVCPGVVGIVADDHARVNLRRFSLAAIGAVIDQPDVAAPNELQGCSKPSALSAG